jgi:hypothetical protein
MKIMRGSIGDFRRINSETLVEADELCNTYKNITIDFFISGLNSGKIRKGYGFKNLGIDPDKGEINIVFDGREVVTIPVRKGTCDFEKINNTRFPTLVVKLTGLTVYITWS